ncbi:hypothetical protein BJ138DRAFT_1115397 [Hygrophoropsis aurantiaca]|uniref:Uncharacterized protein n=1 Tax=Hygrophoropsis aurantiaca TaxID=72124 RepID=A0ACB8A6K1_9AGAM|nr:hypothetical protein BJ138DRAFT_1115397 [Hygrophoropsis aurantiaca]
MNDHGVAQAIRHPDYFIRGGDITFHVEHYIFRVHRYFFERESTYFNQLLASQGDDGEASFDEDTGIYTLEKVTGDDFSRFLWVFYNSEYQYDMQDVPGWLAILTLANRWGFKKVKSLAVRELEKLEIEPVERICIYKEHDIDSSLLVPSYTALCRRKKLSDHPGALKLDMQTVLQLSAARERAQRSAAVRGHMSPTSADAAEEELSSIIMQEFGMVPFSATSDGGINGSSNGPPNGDVIDLQQPPLNKKEKKAAKDAAAKEEKEAAERLAAEKVAAEKIAAEKTAAEKEAAAKAEQERAKAQGNGKPAWGPKVRGLSNSNMIDDVRTESNRSENRQAPRMSVPACDSQPFDFGSLTTDESEAESIFYDAQSSSSVA